ncbi:MAG: lamin tail domain-containing protein [Candidatus Pacebacteria bacterium]|nr:lamin tail domain-containing protein [Candidatus Paceibacterota bacterium]
MKFGFVIFLFLAVPLLACMPQGVVFAESGIFINEIMYDLETGSDDGREWIEIYNGSGVEIDLNNFRIFEADVSHKIIPKEKGESLIISSGGFAVVADNPAKFLIDWPDFGGILGDSSFSLSNKGETLILETAELIDVDSFAYAPELGANGDGNSLQKNGLNWEASSPTPGDDNSSVEPISLLEEEPVLQVQEEMVSDSAFVALVPEFQIKSYAGSNKTVVAGASVEFRGNGYNVDGTLLQNPRYLWNFGDGEVKDGQNIFHTYRYPGEYVAALDVSSGGYSNLDTLFVKALPNEIFISEIKTGADSFVEIRNPSKEEINISGWQIKSGVDVFCFPQNSFIRPLSFLVAPLSLKEIILPEGKGSVNLFYSNDYAADKFEYSGSLAGGQSFSRLSKDSAVLMTKETPGAENKPASSFASVGADGDNLQVVFQKQKEAAAPEEKEEIAENEREIISENNTAAAAIASKKPFFLYFSLAGGISILAALGFIVIRRQG